MTQPTVPNSPADGPKSPADGPKSPGSITFEHLLERARALAGTGQRRILGIVGAPGAGKSHLTHRLLEALGPDLAAAAPMDGFHLAGTVLTSLGRTQRKGAPDTFDGEGYVALLRRLRDQACPRNPAQRPMHDPTHDPARDGVIFAPEYRRDLKESVGSAIPIHAQVPLVITEGNYLLLAKGYWPRVAPVLDEIWFRDVDADTRVQRLVSRRLKTTGEDSQTALEWVMNVDMPNGVAVEETMAKADVIIRAEL